jgi:hypothetical protein
MRTTAPMPRTPATAALLAIAPLATAQPADTDPADPDPSPTASAPQPEQDAPTSPRMAPPSDARLTAAVRTARDPTARPPFPIIQYTADNTLRFRTTADITGTDNGYSVGTTAGSIGATFITSPELIINVTGTAEFAFYDFEGGSRLVPALAGTEDPFDDAQLYQLAVTAINQVDESWTVILGATGRLTYESGAEFDDSYAGNVLGGAQYKLTDTLSIGAGVVLGFDLTPGVNFFPVPIVEWQITDKLLLGTSQRGAGLELTYDRSDKLNLGLLATFEQNEFRLRDDGPISGGIAQDSAVIIAGVVDWFPTDWLTLRAEIGVQAWGELELFASNDDRLFQESTDPALAAKLQLVIKF